MTFLLTGPRPAPILPPHDWLAALVHAALTGDPGVWQGLTDALGLLAANLALGAVILGVTLWASGALARLTQRAVGRLAGARGSDTILQSFLSSLVRWGILLVGLIAVLQQVGVQNTSILAALGAASLAIGLALQGALSNVAASVMILILRPYRLGDFVEINGKSGTVKGLDLFGTRLSDPDNLDIFMPNSKVFGSMIINYSSPSNRRMELNFHIDYDDDLDAAIALLRDCVTEDERILATPAPWVGTTDLTERAVTVTLRAWAPVAIYWDARYDLIRRVKLRLGTQGFAIPYPRQITVQSGPRPVRAADAEATQDRAGPIAQPPSNGA